MIEKYTPEPTISALIAEAHALGFKLSNLFELNLSKGWQANLRDADEIGSGKEFGQGATPEEALTACLEKAKKSLSPRTPSLPAPGSGLFD